MDTSYSAFYEAWINFRKGKKATPAIDQFAYYLEANLEQLSTRIRKRTYKHDAYQKVVIHEKKRRDLAVASVADRVVHRLLYDYLVQIFDNSFDPDVWACRKNMGLHKCLTRVQQLMQRYPHSYVWRADITKFFDYVDHKMLLGALQRKVSTDSDASWLCQEVVKSYSINRTEQNRTEQNRTEQNRTEQNRTGIPIGNLTSQIFSNIYLNEFDRFVRHHIKPQAYVRYGDDFILFFAARRQAFRATAQAKSYLFKSLGLIVSQKNDFIVSAKNGLYFLGHVIDKQVVVDRHTSRQVMAKLNLRIAASYKALYLDEHYKKQLDWILVEQLDRSIKN